MATASNELLEIVLRELAGGGEQPWYPADYVRATGVDRSTLDQTLDELRLGGLVRLTDWVQGKGQGYVLTPAGQEVVRSPHLLNKLRQHGLGHLGDLDPGPDLEREDTEEPGDRYAAVKDALLTPLPPRATLLLLAANVLVFVVGMGLAMTSNNNKALGAYLAPWRSPAEDVKGRGEELEADFLANQIRHNLGGLMRNDIVREQQWWRLLGHAFVHAGWLHLLVNMYMLFSLGPMLERMWGSWRFLVLYLIAAAAGGVAGILWQADQPLWLDEAGRVVIRIEAQHVGASGALCGLIGSMLVWVWLNRRYLPSSMAAEWMRSIFINIMLIALISMIPGISWAGHLGGGLGGAIVAVPLVYHRFGQPQEKWLALIAIVAAPLALFGYLQQQLMTRPEVQQAREMYQTLLVQARHRAEQAYDKVAPLLERAWKGKAVPAAEVQAATNEIDRARQKLREVQETLAKARTYQDQGINQALLLAREYIETWDKYLETARSSIDREGRFVVGNRGLLKSRIDRINALARQVFEDSVLGFKKAP